jgi:hypothetical protein
LQQSNPKKQLRSVILLLAIAVILPTVCLLWFMTQAVKNVRFAAQQRVIDSYQKELTNADAKAGLEKAKAAKGSR